MSESAAMSVFDAKYKGEEKYRQYVEDCFVFGRKSVRDIISKTNLELFSGQRKQTNANKLRITDLRHDSKVFCKLYVSSQNRQGDVDDFFARENNKFPPCISEFGKLRKAKNKSYIVSCLQDFLQGNQRN